LRGDLWSGFDPTGLERDAEPPMNPEVEKAWLRPRSIYVDIDQNPP
jgi:hypothetical protein